MRKSVTRAMPIAAKVPAAGVSAPASKLMVDLKIHLLHESHRIGKPSTPMIFKDLTLEDPN
jgi:hypothetical protein